MKNRWLMRLLDINAGHPNSRLRKRDHSEIDLLRASLFPNVWANLSNIWYCSKIVDLRTCEPRYHIFKKYHRLVQFPGWHGTRRVSLKLVHILCQSYLDLYNFSYKSIFSRFKLTMARRITPTASFLLACAIFAILISQGESRLHAFCKEQSNPLFCLQLLRLAQASRVIWLNSSTM